MKKIGKKAGILLVTALLALGTVLTGCSKEENKLNQINKKKVITICTSPDFAPMEFIDPEQSGQDQYVGADIELAKYIAESLGVELKIVPMDFDAVLSSIGQGKYDLALAGLSSDPIREDAMDFSDGYYTTADGAAHGLLIREEDKEKFKILTDFADCTIVAQSASIQEGFAKNQIPDAKEHKVITAVTDGFLMVQEGKADACATAFDTGELFAQANSGVIMAEPLFDTDADINRIAVTKGQDELLAKVNEIIAEVKEQGLYTKWFEEAKVKASKLGLK